MTFLPGILAILPLSISQNTAPASAVRSDLPQQSTTQQSTALQSATPQSGAPHAPLLDHRELSLAMARLATEHPDLVTVLPVGESRGKRRIDALRIAAGERAPGRPAILIVANIDGPLVWTSGVALDHAQELAGKYASDAKVKALLDTTTIYVVPRADPDAAEARFAKPLYEQRATGTGVDNDRDGRQGEDPPSDVDGDGKITWLRVADPEGDWIADPNDPRAMVKCDHAKGQRGTWKLWPEGRDSDKDERVAEDSEFDAVLNRNFPQGWIEHAPESGLFATDEPGARALCEFVITHLDIALVVTYGTLDDVVDRPKTEPREPRRSANPSDGIPDSDATLYAEIGRRYKLAAKGSKGDGKDAGTFQAWVQAQRGLWTVNLAGWSIPLDEPAPKKEGEGDAKPVDDKASAGKTDAEKTAAEKTGAEKTGAEKAVAEKSPGDASNTEKNAAGKPSAAKLAADKLATNKTGADAPSGEKPAPGDDVKRLRWIDAKNEGARFVAWHAFQHPELGPVEIGGFAPFALVEPPEADRAEIAQKNFDFLVTLGEMLPRVKVVDAQAKDLGAGLWEVKAWLENDALLPYMSALGHRTGVIRPARVDLALPREAQLLAGRSEQLVGDLAGSGARQELRWLVRGAPPSAMKIQVDTDHAGTASVVPEVK
jgi:hypothetical protein